jgi:hypothetical protein
MTNLTGFSVEQLRRAVAVREQIAELEQELAGILGDSSSSVKGISGNGRRVRRKMSASARAKIAAAQRARWARQKKGQTGAAPLKKGRRKMSASARAKIAAAARARWAKAKAANRNSLAA